MNDTTSDIGTYMNCRELVTDILSVSLCAHHIVGYDSKHREHPLECLIMVPRKDLGPRPKALQTFGAEFSFKRIGSSCIFS